MKKMNKKNSNLDERQELKLLNIEHNGCWLAFWGLLASIFVQMALGNGGMEQIAGEWVVFMCLAVYLVAGCMKNGIWDRRMKPTPKHNAIASGIAASVMGILWFVISYCNYHKFVGSVMTGIFMFLITGFLCLLMLSVSSAVYKKRIRKPEESEEE